MKAGPLTLLVALAAALAGGAASYFFATAHTQATAHSREAELEWLRQEYQLTPAQFNAIRDLHHQYSPRSEETYRRIAAADARAERLISTNHTVTPEVTAALAECEHLHEQGQRDALAYVYTVAEHMAPTEADRYVSAMKLRILEPGTVPHTSNNHWPR